MSCQIQNTNLYIIWRLIKIDFCWKAMFREKKHDISLIFAGDISSGNYLDLMILHSNLNILQTRLGYYKAD